MSGGARYTEARNAGLVSVSAPTPAFMRVGITTALLLASACRAGDVPDRLVRAFSDPLHADSMGARPISVRKVAMREPKDLVESSAAVMSQTQAGVFFTINDSGNDAVLFALDTAGNTRGRWNVENATNHDWEAATRGPCLRVSANASPPAKSCLFLGDVGDNGAARRVVVLYQVEEPAATGRSATGTLRADKLVLRYPDGPHDVESMYVGPDGTAYLLTKRPLKGVAGELRGSLVFTIPAVGWLTRDTITAILLDSLPIVPGSSAHRRLTDASLSPDSRLLAVRTYGQVYIFVTDSSTGRVINAVAPSVCNIEDIEGLPGEGITWVGAGPQLLLTREGRNAPIQIITCPLPQR